MAEKQAGLTAFAMAYARAHHAEHASPKIFDDFLAPSLFTPEERTQTDRDWVPLLPYIAPELAATDPDPQTALAWVVQLTNGPITLGRSRYTEASLEDALRRGLRQYVMLGAGFDTFAYRRRDLANRLQVFELDHPATQALKGERIARQAWDPASNLHTLPIDFTAQSLADVLSTSSYDPGQLSFFSWLGVSFYLPLEVVLDSLRAIVSIAAPGSSIVFDYLDLDAFDPQKAGKRMQQMIWMAEQLGEPLKSGFDPLALSAELARLGLRLEENLDPAAIQARYFQGRSDHYHAVDHFHYARAVVV